MQSAPKPAGEMENIVESEDSLTIKTSIKSEGVVDSSETSSTPLISGGPLVNGNITGHSGIDDRETTIPRAMSNVEAENEDHAWRSVEDADDEAKAGSIAKHRSKSSSKNEGQHTDRRYLCYICNKLFTRRRSVRDHISKIHNLKTWEPTRSLEIIVNPATGEPVEELEKQLYKAAARPLPPLDEFPDQKEAVQDQEPDVHTSPAPEPSEVAVKVETPAAASRSSSVERTHTPMPVIGKKRPAPSSGPSASTKKGTAKVKNTNKKPRLAISESVSDTGGALRSPITTPVSTQSKSAASKVKKQTPLNSAQSPLRLEPSPAPLVEDVDDEEEDTEDDYEAPYSAADTPQTTNSDGEVFCICRKGDNHTWMIACDGGCDEWFHGRCVDIRERDGELIDKYICPKCQAKGVGQTTWKRMCRRKGCRKPARVLEEPPSKYCSVECGRKFFVEMVLRADDTVGLSKNGQFVQDSVKPKKVRKKRKSELVGRDGSASHEENNEFSHRPHTPPSDDGQSEYETDSSADDDTLPNRGGALRAGEVKAILEQRKTIDAWRELGKKPLTPPPYAAEESNGPPSDAEVPYDDFEKQQRARIQVQIKECEADMELLGLREKLIGLIRDRSSKITDEVKKANPKLKDLCGYDPRLSWTKDEFLRWRNSDEGRSVLSAEGGGRLGPPPHPGTPVNGSGGASQEEHGGGGTEEAEESDEDADNMPTKGGVCVKNRCARHGKWAKMQLAEVRFEQDLARRRADRLRRDLDQLRAAAVLRMWEASVRS